MFVCILSIGSQVLEINRTLLYASLAGDHSIQVPMNNRL